MRGYGAPQVVFAVESMLDDAATALGIDPVEIRLRNAAREGDANPLTGKRIYSAGLPECLEKAGKSLNGKNAVQSARTSKAIYVVALASPVLATPLTRPVGVEIAGARLLMNQDGTINVQSGATEIGQGADTVFSQMVAETVGFRSATFALFQHKIPMLRRSIGAFASRQSYVAAPAAQCGTVIKENHRSRRSHATSVSDESDPDKRPYRAD